MVPGKKTLRRKGHSERVRIGFCHKSVNPPSTVLYRSNNRPASYSQLPLIKMTIDSFLQYWASTWKRSNFVILSVFFYLFLLSCLTRQLNSQNTCRTIRLLPVRFLLRTVWNFLFLFFLHLPLVSLTSQSCNIWWRSNRSKHADT